MNKVDREKRNTEIILMRKNGASMNEVAERYNLTLSGVHAICKKYNVDGVMSDRKGIVQECRNQYTNGVFDRETNAIRYINERTPWFEYAGNFTGVDGYVDLKCKACGTVIRKSFVCVKHGKAKCPECLKRESQERAESRRTLKEKQKDKDRYERERNKLKRITYVQMSINVCECCGSIYIPKRQGTKYCSSICCQRVNNSIKKDRRIRNIKDVSIDKSITLKRLYERDNGRCHICGCLCDWNDYHTREDGTFIANNNYPSVDHVLPLNKGGKHVWDNVQLACRGCNSKKGDKIPSLFQIF